MISQAANMASTTTASSRLAATDPVESIRDYPIPIPPFRQPPQKETFQQPPRRRKPRQPDTVPPEPDGRRDRGLVDDYA